MVDVQAGDILLFRGRGFVSKGIRFLDGSEVNHAAIALNSTELSEATGHGLDTASILTSLERNDLTVVLGADRGDPDAAAKRAQEYLGSGVPYAYQQILLLAVLCVTRRIPIKNRIFRRVVRRALEAAADLLNALVDRGADLMICSEYVYRCHRESGFDLLPGGIPDLAGAGGAVDGVVLLSWLEGRPVPLAPMAVPGGPSEHPMAIAEKEQYVLEELLAEYFAGDDPTTPVPMTVGPAVPDVADEELVTAAGRFGRSAARLAALRDPNAPAPQGLGAADAVAALRGMFVTNPNFVTPKDLLFTSQLREKGRHP